MAARDKREAKRLAKFGRRGDKYLLHITGPELQALARTGKLTFNPKTGLPEAGFFSDLLGAVAPVVGSIFGGPLGGAIGGAIGSGISGGNPFEGALRGGLGGGIGDLLGGAGRLESFMDVTDLVPSGFGSAASPFDIDLGFGGGLPEIANRGAVSLGQSGIDNFPNDFDFGTRGLSTFGGGIGDILPRLTNQFTDIPWSTVSKGMDVGSGLYGLMQSRRLQKLAQMMAQQADPFAQYRPGYAAQLQQLMANPASVTQAPGWNAGIQAVRRSAAGRGYLDSGNEISALQNFGGEFFDKETARLAGLAGAGFNPANAGQLMLAGTEGGLNLAGQSLNRLSRGIGGFGMGR